MWETPCSLHPKPGRACLGSCKPSVPRSLGPVPRPTMYVCVFVPSTFPQLLAPCAQASGQFRAVGAVSSHRIWRQHPLTVTSAPSQAASLLVGSGSVLSPPSSALGSEPRDRRVRAPGNQAGLRVKGGDKGWTSTDQHTLGGRGPGGSRWPAQSSFSPGTPCLEQPRTPHSKDDPPAQGAWMSMFLKPPPPPRPRWQGQQMACSAAATAHRCGAPAQTSPSSS